MKLRQLELRDAPLMLEWMHDKNVVENLNTDFSVKTLEDCINFIKSSQNDKQNLHLAITDDSNTYMGTVSLKHIENQTAEFGIAIRTLAIGKGYSRFAMKEIFDKGFNELKLLSIYWCVAPQNKRAIRFYEKNGYKRTSSDNLRLGGGVQQNSNSKFLLVPNYKRRTRKRYLNVVAIAQSHFPPYQIYQEITEKEE